MTAAEITNQLRVMYIEDDPMTQSELSRYLKRRLGRLYSVSCCEDALNILEIETVDLIITDLRMPGMTGLQLIERLRQLGNPVPVIITSAFSDSETILQAVDLGIVKYVVKPIDVEVLMKTVRDISAMVFKQRGGIVFQDLIVNDRESRVAVEGQIKRELAHAIKSLTGKGPKDISVFLKQEVLEVQITEGYTPIELQLYKSSAHHSLLSAFRRNFYESASLELCQPIAVILGTRVTLKHIQIDLAAKRDGLVFSLL